MTVSIVPINLRDASYVAANLRPEDWREIACQLPDGTEPLALAWMAAEGSGEAWTASWKGQPVAAFGASPMTPSVLSLWAWGTKGMWRVAGSIERFVTADCVPRWLEAGITRVEARSIVGHVMAHRWLRRLGFAEQPCPQWGKAGEDFILFSWTRKEWFEHAR